MGVSTILSANQTAQYRGLRMTAAEFLELEEDGCRYELVDGVVCRSPSTLYWHQKVAAEILAQIAWFLRSNPIGDVLAEVDVDLGPGPRGGERVYRPDVVFVRQEHVPANLDYIKGPPDLIVEVVSASSRRYDHETKKDDYQRCGVPEYWIIDPQQGAMTFYRHRDGRYAEIKPEGNSFTSEAVVGFTLDLARLRQAFGVSPQSWRFDRFKS
ncbi:MAG: Uma2 family endonuclease [Planctomycetes bacterium]|nr:Uma2 family endonuclease [Planctomycetota bacterium]